MQADVSNKKKPQVVLSFGGWYYGVSTVYVVLNCSWSGFFVLIWCLVVPPIPTIDEILKCPPQPPLYEFVYGFGQIDWYAKIPSTTSHVVLMTSHLNEWSWNFSKFSKFFLWVYVKVTHSQRMGIGTWGWDNPCPKDGFGLHLRFLL
jgi:hypothetical protein